MSDPRRARHPHPHAFSGLNPLEREGLVVAGRRNMLKAGLAGMAGLGLPDLLRCRARASEAGIPPAFARRTPFDGIGGIPSRPGRPASHGWDAEALPVVRCLIDPGSIGMRKAGGRSPS